MNCSLTRWQRGARARSLLSIPTLAVPALIGSLVSAEHPGTRQATNSEPAEQAPYYRPSDASTRIVVVAPEQTFAARVRGQVSDLDAEVVSHTESITGTWSEQGERARSLARSADRTLIAWLSEMPAPPGATASDASRTFVAVFFSSTGRLYARAVGPPLTTASTTSDQRLSNWRHSRSGRRCVRWLKLIHLECRSAMYHLCRRVRGRRQVLNARRRGCPLPRPTASVRP